VWSGFPRNIVCKYTILTDSDAVSLANKKGQQSIQTQQRKQQKLFELVEKFRRTEDPKAAKLLGEKLGRMVFGG
jgi:hypothetical protein